MPDAAQFLAGFGLIQGTRLGDFVLYSATSTHESIKRYQEYKYSITLSFNNTGSGIYENLYHDVMNIISQQPIIYGIRNAYSCSIETPQYGNIVGDNNVITFYLVGHSYRT